MRDWFDNAMWQLKLRLRWTVLGNIIGAAIVYQFVYLPLQKDSADGWCGKYDPRQRFYEYTCIDALIAAQLQQDGIGKIIADDEAKRTKKEKKK